MKFFKFIVDPLAVAFTLFYCKKNLYSQIPKDKLQSFKNIYRTYNLKDIDPVMRTYIDGYMETDDFKDILKKTHEDKIIVEEEWTKNKNTIEAYLHEILGFEVSKEVHKVHTVYILPRGGSNKGDYRITWGLQCANEFENYSTVYLTHEFLHTILGTSSHISHAIIELITDNELRKRLNGLKDYSHVDKRRQANCKEYGCKDCDCSNVPDVGHEFLAELRTKINPFFQLFKKDDKNIYQFVKEMEKVCNGIIVNCGE